MKFGQKYCQNLLMIPFLYHVFYLTQVKNQFYVFSDALAQAFACCAYIVSHFQSYCESRLIFAKSKIKPKKYENVFIHRLELLAALLGTRVLKYLSAELKEINANFKLNL